MAEKVPIKFSLRKDLRKTTVKEPRMTKN